MARNRRLSKRLAVGLGLALLLLLGLAVLPAQAAEFRSGGIVTIEQGQVIDDDLFVGARRVVINGTINGDLWIACSQAEVNGTVHGSVFFVGRQLDVRGKVDGSTYSAGGLAVLASGANVTRNVYFAGYALSIEPGAVVGRDAFATGNQALIGGQVVRNVSFGGSALDIQGTIGGNVNATVAAPGSNTTTPPPGVVPLNVNPAAPGIRVSEGAHIGGQLVYRSPVDQSANIKSQPAGGVVFTQMEQPEQQPVPTTAGGWAFAWLRLYGTLLALGALARYGLGAPLRGLSEKVAVVPLLSIGWGLLIILAGFASAIVAGALIFIVTGLLSVATFRQLATVVFFGAGTGWAFGFTIFLLALIWGSRIVISYLLGWLVLERLAGKRHVQSIWVLLAGTGIYSLVQSIPFVGAVALGLALVLGFGAIYLVWRDSLRPAGTAPGRG